MRDALKNLAKLQDIQKLVYQIRNSSDKTKIAELSSLLKKFNQENKHKGDGAYYPDEIIEEAEFLSRQLGVTSKEHHQEATSGCMVDDFYCQRCESIEKSSYHSHRTRKIEERSPVAHSYALVRDRVCERCGFVFSTQETLLSKDTDDEKEHHHELHLEYKCLDSLDTAHEFIRSCIYWLDHPTSSYVRVPRMADRIYNGDTGFTIDFGANKFLISVVFKRIVDTLNDVLVGTVLVLDDDWIDLILRGAVANFKGVEYTSYYPVTDDCFLKFGAHGIEIDEARAFIIRHPELEAVFQASEYQEAVDRGQVT